MNNIIDKPDLMCHSCGCNLVEGDTHAKTVSISTYKLFYIFRGSCVFRIDGNDFLLAEDASVMIFPFQKYEITESSQIKFFWIEFSGFQASVLIAQTAFSRKTPTVGRLGQAGFEYLFEYPNCSSRTLYDNYRNNAVLLLIFSYYLEHYPVGKDKESEYLKEASELIRQNYSDPSFNVQKLADLMQIDRSYLYRIIKDSIGISPVEFLTNCRISIAEMLLIKESLSVKEVAFAVGYTDQLYFSRAFKRLSGSSPSEHRKRVKAPVLFKFGNE